MNGYVEYAAILQPTDPEEPPRVTIVLAEDESDAYQQLDGYSGIEDTLDLIPAKELTWNARIMEDYWRLYRS